MKRYVNTNESMRSDLIEGITLAYPDMIELWGDGLIANKKLSGANRVAVVIAGTAGHEPSLIGHVGEGLVDLCIYGDISVTPDVEHCVEGIRMADRGKGVLFLAIYHKNDLAIAEEAVQRANASGTPTRLVVLHDDVATQPRDKAELRKGLIGVVPAYKIAAAAAKKGLPLDEVARITQRLVDQTGTMSSMYSQAFDPKTGVPFTPFCGENEMLIEGYGKMPMQTAKQTAEKMVSRIVEDLSLTAGERVMLLVNGTGATTPMELYIVFRDAYGYLADRGISVVASLTAELLTVQEMGGLHITIARMDDELLELWKAPCCSPALTL